MKKEPINYFFNWVGGGYNTVKATSRKEALKKATELGMSPDNRRVTLVPLESSLKADRKYKRTFEEDKKYAGMFD